MNKPRMMIRLTENQRLVLEELKNILNCNISLLVRAIIGDWLEKNEDYIYDIIEGRREFDKDWMNNKELEINEEHDE